MIKDIIDNLDYFSEVTQRTLSAFHVSGIDESLFEEIDNIKRFITNTKTKILVTAELLDSGKYKRYFSDNSTDIVNLEEINSPAYYENDKFDFSLIEKCLKKEMTPISKLRFGIINQVHEKEITMPSEKIFFM